MKKINVGVLFGGKSVEHEVSLRSAKNIVDALDKEKYNPVLISIDKKGEWLLGGDLDMYLKQKNESMSNKKYDSVAVIPESNGNVLNLNNSELNLKIDVVFPILHGTFGEDGTVQGLLKLAHIPFVGADVLGSAIGMDKDVTKRLLRDAGIPIADFLVLKNSEKIPDYSSVAKKLGTPFFIKPANSGSSVGVNKAHNEEEYLKFIEDAFKYDRKILLEKYIVGREIECSVLGNENPIASVLGEIISQHEFYSYEAKYLDENGAILEMPAKLPPEISEKVRNLATEVFKTLCCEGMARVDFFLKEDGSIIVNEINTIPGFTAISMYPRLWEATGIGYSELINKLINLAIDKFEQENKLETSYK